MRVVDRETGKRHSYIYASETEARLAIPKLRRDYSRPVGEPLKKALEQYEAYLGLKGKLPGVPIPFRSLAEKAFRTKWSR